MILESTLSPERSLMIIIFSYFLNKFFFVFIGLLGLGLLIAIHELGHFLLCKLFNVYTPSFSIGFGPIILTKKIGETDFKLSAIPLGGYVEIAQSEDQVIPQESNALYFETINWWKKLSIMLGGIAFNLLSAYLIFIGLTIGKDHTIIYKNYASCAIKEIKQGSEAFNKNLNASFTIEKIDEFSLDQTKPLLGQLEILMLSPFNPKVTFTNNAHEIIELVLEIPNETITNEKKKAWIIFEKLSDLGITFTIKKPISVVSAIATGIKQTNNLIHATFSGLISALKGSSSASLSGPIMIIAISSKVIEKGVSQFLIFLALISINLALMNLIPLPILDGGQILFLAIELIFRRPLNSKIREYISLICWIGFIVLFVYLSWNDILKLIKLS
jgi:regulator of sigma E protease